jgi:hypothetical protein
MRYESFASLMAAVVAHLGLAPLPGPAQDVYTVHFEDKRALHVIDTKDGHLDVMGEAGRLVNLKDADTLLDLLALNTGRCQAGVTVHRSTGVVVVWGRRLRAQLDVAGLVQLLQASRQQACAAHQRLGKPVVRAPQYSAAALSRLMRQQS